ncbi:putative ribonuclease H-like domain-containing protein [Tanacetum coccineum]
MYSFDMKNIVPKESLTCLVAKATLDESMLWHRRLGHINFKNINKLVKDNLVRGLPLKLFENDQTCVACLKGKQHRASCKSKNGVAERRNRTLIEDARTMLADSMLPTTFWAEAVSTACYVHNRVIVVKPHNKTPYELFRGFKPALSFMRPFGCHVTILNTLHNLGKFDGKSDEGFFVGYSLSSKAFRVYNTRTNKVEENLHVGFLENKPMLDGNGPKWLFDIDSLTQSMNYVPVFAGILSNESADASYFDSPSKNVGNDEPKSAPDDPKQVKDGPINKSNDNDKSEDDSSPKEVNTDGQQVNTASPEVNIVVSPVNTASPKDMLGASHLLEATHIKFFSDKDEPEVGLGNIPNTYAVPTTPHTRIHKDHPLEHVISDVQSSIQTRGMKISTSEQGFSVLYMKRKLMQVASDDWRDALSVIILSYSHSRGSVSIRCQGYIGDFVLGCHAKDMVALCFGKFMFMLDLDESGVTYTAVSSTFGGLSDIGSPGVVGPEDEGLPWMLDDPYVQVALQALPSPYYIPGPEEPQSPPPLDYVLEPIYLEFMPQEDESDPEADLEEDDDEDPEENPVDYPADGGDKGDDEDEPSEDDEEDDVPYAEETEPFETDESAATPPPHPAYRVTARISILAPVPTPAWSDSEVATLLTIPTPPPSPLSLWSSPLPQIPFPPLPLIPSPSLPLSPPLPVSSTPPTSLIRSLGYRAAMIQLRAEAPSTSHSLLLPSTYHLTPPSGTPSLLPIPAPTASPPLLLPSASRREDKPEVTLPPQKRLGIALGPRYKVGESSSAAAARLARGLRADYSFVATMDREIRRDPERDVGYGITNSWDEIVEALQGAPISTDTELGRHMVEFETRVRQDAYEIYTRLDDGQTE